jgi:putative transcription factor
MDCELCGRHEVRIDAMIDGIKMRVCENCSRFGKVVYVEPSQGGEEMAGHQKKADIELEPVDNYAALIKQAREKKGMTCKELCAAIAEKESFMDRIEKGQAVPTEKIGRKLEHFLKIKIFESVDEGAGAAKMQPKPSQGLTLGDTVNVKTKKK